MVIQIVQKSRCVALLTSVMILVSGVANADVLCVANKARVAKNGTVSLKTALRVAQGTVCPKGTSKVVATDAFVGPQGPQGVAGTINLALCRWASGAGVATTGTAGVTNATAACGSSEYVLTYGTSLAPNGSLAFINEERLLVDSLNYPVGVFVRTQTEQEASVIPAFANYTLTVSVICCPR